MSSLAINSSTQYPIQNLNITLNVNSGNKGNGASNISSSNNNPFLQTVIQALQGIVPSTSGSNLTSNTVVPASTSSNVGQTLGKFLYDLYQTLAQGNATTQGNTTSGNGDGDSDSNSATSSSSVSGYSSPTANLQNLISSLNSNASSNTGNANTLQTDFTNLVSSLGGSSSSTSLQNFLQQLVSNTGSSDLLQSGLGSLFNAQA